MRTINKLIIHCSATPETMDIGAKEINRWHKQRGWRGIGYHYVIRRNGELEPGRQVSQAGAHARGYNKKSIGICLIGGVDSQTKKPENNFTKEQFGALLQVIKCLRNVFVDVKILGHRDLPHVNKACPCFDVRDWAETNGINPNV